MMLTPLATFKPEIAVSVFGLVLLVYGAFRGEKAVRAVFLMAIIGLITAAGILLSPRYGGSQGVSVVHIFNHMLVQDDFARFVKFILLAAAAFSLLMSWSYLANQDLARFEYPILVLLATLGMMLMVSANDLLGLYVGLELQSLALYVLAAFRRDNAKSSEAGLKYFVLGALSSGLILYGISLVYGFTGTTSFEGLAHILHGYGPCEPEIGPGCSTPPIPLGLIFGLVFICAALAFKVSAVPFHMWTPDVYEGAPTPVTAFFAAAPKVAGLALFARFLMQPMMNLSHQWVQIVVFIAIASMILGSFAGLAQSNLKRLMAYSSIANVGFALVGLALANESGIQALLIYLAIYYLNTLGAFAIILCLRRNGKMVEDIKDLSGLSKTNPLLALAMGIFMFSLVGVPPFAGFFGKYFVFLAAVKAHMVPIAIIGVLTSVVSAFYYLRIIKIMYFDDATQPIDAPKDMGVNFVMAVSAVFMLVFTFLPAPLIDSALTAARSLTHG